MSTPMSPYLMFNGNCADAMKFYQQLLGGKLDLMRMKDAPPSPQVPASDAERVMHARLAFDGGTIMASDTRSTDPKETMKGMSLAVTFADGASAKKAYEKLAEGGKKSGPPAGESFFAAFFGTVTDRFGTPWMITGGMKGLM